MHDGMIDIETAAAEIGVSKFLVRALIRRGDLPYFRVGRRILLSKGDISNFLQSNRHEARERKHI